MWNNTLGKFGENPNVGTSLEDVWDTGGLYSYLNLAEQLKIFSDSSDDSSEGIGLRTVQLYGLNEDYLEINEIVTLNGLTAVTTVNHFLRIFRMIGRSAGSGGTNVGNIFAKDNAGTNTLAQIQIGNAQTLMALWTVPIGKTLYLSQWWVTSLDEKGAKFSLFVRPHNEVFQLKRKIILKDNSFKLAFPAKFPIAEKSDIAIRILCEKEGSIVTSGFDGWYE